MPRTVKILCMVFQGEKSCVKEIFDKTKGSSYVKYEQNQSSRNKDYDSISSSGELCQFLT